ncbi:MAG: DUF1634 domain-containing protein [Chloroflexota bacterium]|nr:DUF1634 domain-containing protein [Chloroflexota bacterium]
MARAISTADDTRAYRAVASTMLGGLLGSIAVMVIGLILATLHGKNAISHVLPLDQVIPSLFHGKPEAVLDLGILLLFATPLVGVVVAWVQFIRQEDRAFTVLTAVLLLLLAIGFAVALR